MTDAVPIISIVSGAAVAIAVPLITAATQSGERQRQHRRERLAALRGTLVNFCFKLSETSTAMINAATSVGIHGNIEVKLPDAAEPEAAYRLYREHLLETYRASLVLVLELGPDDEVVKAAADAIAVLNRLQVTLIEAREGGRAEELHDKVHEEVGAYFDCERHFHQVGSRLLVSREEEDRSVLGASGERLRRGGG